MLLARAGVPRARLHDARHTAATLLLTQGVPALVAMEILGHSQATLTLGTYSHVTPEVARRQLIEWLPRRGTATPDGASVAAAATVAATRAGNRIRAANLQVSGCAVRGSNPEPAD